MSMLCKHKKNVGKSIKGGQVFGAGGYNFSGYSSRGGTNGLSALLFRRTNPRSCKFFNFNFARRRKVLSNSVILRSVSLLSLCICMQDQDGNWQVGAIATLIDGLGALTVHSFTGNSKASVDLTISFYSSAKIQEEAEIEAKVVGGMGKLTSLLVEVKRKSNRELIALGKNWMTSKL